MKLDAYQSAQLLSDELARRAVPCDAMTLNLKGWRSDDSRDGTGLCVAVVEGLRDCDCLDVDIDGLEHMVLLPLLADLPLPYAVHLDINHALLQKIDALGDASVEALVPLLGAYESSHP